MPLPGELTEEQPAECLQGGFLWPVGQGPREGEIRPWLCQPVLPCLLGRAGHCHEAPGEDLQLSCCCKGHSENEWQEHHNWSYLLWQEGSRWKRGGNVQLPPEDRKYEIASWTFYNIKDDPCFVRKQSTWATLTPGFGTEKFAWSDKKSKLNWSTEGKIIQTWFNSTLIFVFRPSWKPRKPRWRELWLITSSNEMLCISWVYGDRRKLPSAITVLSAKQK